MNLLIEIIGGVAYAVEEAVAKRNELTKGE